MVSAIFAGGILAQLKDFNAFVDKLVALALGRFASAMGAMINDGKLPGPGGPPIVGGGGGPMPGGA